MQIKVITNDLKAITLMLRSLNCIGNDKKKNRIPLEIITKKKTDGRQQRQEFTRKRKIC